MSRVLLLASPHPILGAALRHLASETTPPVRIDTAFSISAAVHALARPDYDGVIVDLEFHPGDPLSAFESVRWRNPGLPVLAVWSRADGALARTLEASGARGLVTKTDNADTLTAAIQAFLNGERWFPAGEANGHDQTDTPLTRRQLAVLRELSLGKGNREIAKALQISEATVRSHLAAIFRALKVANRSQAILAFLNQQRSGREMRSVD